MDTLQDVELKYGKPSPEFHRLFESITVRDQNALAVSFHLICASSGLTLNQSKQILNRYTTLCTTGLGSSKNNFYVSHSTFSAIYKIRSLPDCFRTSECLTSVNICLNSDWAEELSLELKTIVSVVEVRWHSLLLKSGLTSQASQNRNQAPEKKKEKTHSSHKGFLHTLRDKLHLSHQDKTESDISQRETEKRTVSDNSKEMIQKRGTNTKSSSKLVVDKMGSEPKKRVDTPKASFVAKPSCHEVASSKVEKKPLTHQEKRNTEGRGLKEIERKARPNNIVSQSSVEAKKDYSSVNVSRPVTIKQKKEPECVEITERESVGIDLCNHKHAVSTCSYENETFVCSGGIHKKQNSLPSVILPTWPREKLLADIEIEGHRRGLGLLWPPESQVPFGGLSDNGVGRVPVVGAICKMHAEGLENEWKSFLESSFHWRPQQKSVIREDATKIVAHATKQYSHGAKHTALAVPEGFTEGTRQAVIDACAALGIDNLTLVPRSICMAIQWCAENNKNYSNKTVSNPEGDFVGALITLSLGMDLWEVKVIEIRVVSYAGKNWLVPIHDPSINSVSLDACGLAYSEAMLSTPVHQKWYALHGTDWFQRCLDKGNAGQLYDAEALYKALMFGASAKELSKLDVLSGIYELHKSPKNLNTDMCRSILQQVKEMGLTSESMIATVASGSFAKLKLPKGESVEELLTASFTFKFPPLYSCNDRYVSDGAATTAMRIINGLPSYRAKLIPVDIYTITRNKSRDKTISWIPLIKGDTVEAGKTYTTNEPISGLSIPAESEKLTLTLRRPASSGDNMYRMVNASLPQKTESKEAVDLFASVKPGQGFSRVDIESTRPGIFSTMLDWRSMEETSEPEQLLLEYIPDVSYVESNRSMFENAESELIQLKKILINRRFNQELVNDARDKLNKWPLATTSSTGNVGLKNIFKHRGVLNSNGSLDNIPNKTLVTDLVDCLDKAFQRNHDDSLLRLGGWLYQLIPASMLEYTENCLKRGVAGRVELHVAGQSFHTTAQFKLFFNAFYHECKRSSFGLFEWFRALRNIVRFQDHALSEEAVSKHELDEILSTLLYILETELTQGTGTNNVNNCLQACLFILKRRRYDDSFLNIGEPETIRLEKVLEYASKKHRTIKYRKFAAAALNFLHKKATAEDASKVLES